MSAPIIQNHIGESLISNELKPQPQIEDYAFDESESFLNDHSELMSLSGGSSSKYCSQISVKDFEREGIDFTKQELMKLMQSPEYKDYQIVVESKKPSFFFRVLRTLLLLGIFCLVFSLSLEYTPVGRYINKSSVSQFAEKYNVPARIANGADVILDVLERPIYYVRSLGSHLAAQEGHNYTITSSKHLHEGSEVESSSALPSQLLVLINKDRSDKHLSQLEWSNRLAAVALEAAHNITSGQLIDDVRQATMKRFLPVPKSAAEDLMSSVEEVLADNNDIQAEFDIAAAVEEVVFEADNNMEKAAVLVFRSDDSAVESHHPEHVFGTWYENQQEVLLDSDFKFAGVGYSCREDVCAVVQVLSSHN